MISIKSLFLTTLSSTLIAVPALAVGQFTVENSNGEIDTYSNVTITHTADTLYFKPSDSNITLVINKKDCKMENSLQVCTTGDVVLRTYGVDETLDINQMFVFINPTKEKQLIQGSTVSLSPNTVLVEILTEKGTYINGMGQIDSMQKP